MINFSSLSHHSFPQILSLIFVTLSFTEGFQTGRLHSCPPTKTLRISYFGRRVGGSRTHAFQARDDNAHSENPLLNSFGTPSTIQIESNGRQDHREVENVESSGGSRNIDSGSSYRDRCIELEKENEKLRQMVAQLETDKQLALDQASVAANGRSSPKQIVLETFEGQDEWCDELEDGMCPVEPTTTFSTALRDRAYWLVGLLALQSCSGFILARNEALLADHPTIVYFLTMLVGAGGNAGNQAAVRVIRGLALGTLNKSTQGFFLWRELKMAISLSSILSVAGFVRAVVFRTPMPETIAVTAALFMIVLSSVCLGAVLPLGLEKVGVDPAHSSTTIQVIMDILGVVMAVAVSRALLDSSLGALIISSLT